MLKKVIRKTVFIYTIFGTILGIGLLIASFFTDKVVVQNGDEIVASGIKAGLITAPVCILTSSLMGLIHGIILWFPIVYLFKKLSKKK